MEREGVRFRAYFLRLPVAIHIIHIIDNYMCQNRCDLAFLDILQTSIFIYLLVLMSSRLSVALPCFHVLFVS